MFGFCIWKFQHTSTRLFNHFTNIKGRPMVSVKMQKQLRLKINWRHITKKSMKDLRHVQKEAAPGFLWKPWTLSCCSWTYGVQTQPWALTASSGNERELDFVSQFGLAINIWFTESFSLLQRQSHLWLCIYLNALSKSGHSTIFADGNSPSFVYG